MNFLCQFIALWSAAVSQRFGVTRESNAIIEILFRTEKYIELNNKSNIVIPIFIIKEEEKIMDVLQEIIVQEMNIMKPKNGVIKVLRLSKE